jgi:cysteinyl-tRNA synthetase
MAWKHLGETFDIHGGGIDLVFPHHENEIAQTRCAFHSGVMANYWMHNGFLQVEGEKMSKSLGNFFTIRDLLKKWPGDVLRLQMLMSQYRQPIDWTESRNELAVRELEDWAAVLGGYYRISAGVKPHAVAEAVSDDLNTPQAITVLRDLYRKAKSGSMNERLEFAANCQLLGFRCLDKPGYFRHGVQALNVDGNIFKYHDDMQHLRAAAANNAGDGSCEFILARLKGEGLGVDVSERGVHTLVPLANDKLSVEDKINGLIAKRNAARAAKDFKESDRIRDELFAMGVVLKDSKEGTTWEIAR